VTEIQSAILGVISIATGTTVVAAQRTASVAPLAGVKIGTADGMPPPFKIAPSPRAAPAASTARNVGLLVKDDRNTLHYFLILLLLNDDWNTKIILDVIIIEY